MAGALGNIPWKTFINFEAIMAWASQLMANCAAQDVPPEEQVAQLQNPGIVNRARLKRQVRRGNFTSGLSRQQLKANEDKIIAYILEEGKAVANNKLALQDLRLAAKDLEPLFDDGDGDED